jgi:hypothetical protein
MSGDIAIFGGETIYNGFPWPEAAKGTRLQAHPFQRKGEAMFA